MRRAPKSAGRPPLGRTRQQYKPRLEESVLEGLVEQSTQAGIPRTTYLERVISLAHDFESPFLRPTALPLPTVVNATVLRQHIVDLDPEQCTPACPDVRTSPTIVRVDKELGERINAWCDRHDVEYSSYVRSILLLAAGYESAEQLRPHHVQDQLVPYDVDRGRAVAS